jgi:hypothetical protein
MPVSIGRDESTVSRSWYLRRGSSADHEALSPRPLAVEVFRTTAQDGSEILIQRQ